MIPLSAIIKFAPWVLFAGACGTTLFYRGQYLDCKNTELTDALRAQERQRVLREADEKFTTALEGKAKEIKDAIEQQAKDSLVALSKVKSDPNCVRTPAASAFDAAVLPKPGQATTNPTRITRP